MTEVDLRPMPLNERSWRQGFQQGSNGLDCLRCGGRVGARPELADRHRQWHAEMDSHIVDRLVSG